MGAWKSIQDLSLGLFWLPFFPGYTYTRHRNRVCVCVGGGGGGSVRFNSISTAHMLARFLFLIVTDTPTYFNGVPLNVIHCE